MLYAQIMQTNNTVTNIEWPAGEFTIGQILTTDNKLTRVGVQSQINAAITAGKVKRAGTAESKGKGRPQSVYSKV